MDSRTLGGYKWISQTLCTVGFLSAFLNFHLFFFHPHPGIGPVLLGWINLNVITDNRKIMPTFEPCHTIQLSRRGDDRPLTPPTLLIRKSTRHQYTKSQFKLCTTPGYLSSSQWLLQTSQKFLKTNWIFIQYPIKNKLLSCMTLKQEFFAWVLQVNGENSVIYELITFSPTNLWSLIFSSIYEYRQQAIVVLEGPGISPIKPMDFFHIT